MPECEAPEYCGKICHCGQPVGDHSLMDNHPIIEMYCSACQGVEYTPPEYTIWKALKGEPPPDEDGFPDDCFTF
jgi:hypothetical protein